MNLLKSTAIALVLSANVSAFAASADEHLIFDGGPRSFSALRSALDVSIPGAGAPKRAKAALDNINAVFANPEEVAKALGLSKLDAKSIKPFVQTAEAGDEQFTKLLRSKGLLEAGAPVSDDSDDEEDDRAPTPVAPTDAKLLRDILESAEFAAQLKMIKTTLKEAVEEAKALPADASKEDKDELAKRIADLEVGVKIAEALKTVNVDQIVGQEEQITEQLKKIAGLESKANLLSREIEAEKEAKAQTAQAMTELKGEMTGLNTRFKAAQDENAQTIAAKDKEIEGFTSQVKGLNGQIEALGQEKGLLETRVTELSAALDEAKKDSAGAAKIKELEGNLKTANDDLTRQADRLTALETEKEEAVNKLTAATEELKMAKTELEDLRASNIALANEAAKLATAIGGFADDVTDPTVQVAAALENLSASIEAYQDAYKKPDGTVAGPIELFDLMDAAAQANAAAPAAAAASGFDAQAFFNGLTTVEVGSKSKKQTVVTVEDLKKALGLSDK